MKSLKLNDSLYWNGVLDPELRVFDIIMNTEFGTTYNSYLLTGSEKSAIFETAKLKFWDEYKEALAAVTDVNKIDYVVMNHTEPDHAGSIEKLIELNPRITVVATATAISFLKEIINGDFNSLTVSDGDTLSLGDKTLKFLVLPNLHWPDTMYTFVEEDGLLFPCDSFGSHYSHEGILRSTVTDYEGYMRATKYYFDNIIGPFKNPYMVDALERIKDLEIKMICPGHGPVLDSNIEELIEIYRGWCEAPAKNEKPLVVIPYVSAYGYTGELAERIIAGIKESGDIEVRSYDLVDADPAVVSADIAAADGLLFGTPTILADALAPIWDLMTGMYPPIHGGKLASAFGSYGWSGEGVPNIIERLKQLKMEVVDGFSVRLKPSESQLLDAYEFGYCFGSRLIDAPCKCKELKVGGKVMMKCMVCGEVFPAGTESCPVCGVGPDKFVAVESNETDFRKDTDEKFLILGGGPGAHYAAAAIRERNATAEIVIVTDEAQLPYNRPMLTKAVLADFENDSFAITGAAWYEENNVKVALNTRVVSIDPAAKKVVCENAEFVYDKLIYALGARCFVPPIKGSDAEYVISIRKISDTDKIKAVLAERQVEKVVVIGGGVMGLEAAWELKKNGYDVTVLETAPGLLPKQLDDPASAMLEEVANNAGLQIVCGAGIAEITEEGVLLNDGRFFEAKLVIMSTGMRPNVAIAQEAGVVIDKMIVVDGQMRTNLPDFYAVGDCVEYKGAPQAFWAQAVETGRIAGANAAGEELTYKALGASLVINAMNTSIFALGTNGKDGKNYRTVEMRDTQRNNYEKYYFYNNQLAGVILIGDTSKMVDLTAAIDAKASFAEVIK